MPFLGQLETTHRHNPGRLAAVVLLWLLAWSSVAFAWTGKVVGVHDGDTLSVLRNGRAIKLRLNAIDAPELHQSFGQQSRKSLSGLCYGRFASVEPVSQDKYDRIVARVLCGGRDVNAEQLRRGMAWHYTQYSHSQELQALEDEARSHRRGLWSSGKAEPPWNYRHKDDPQSQSSPQSSH